MATHRVFGLLLTLSQVVWQRRGWCHFEDIELLGIKKNQRVVSSLSVEWQHCVTSGRSAVVMTSRTIRGFRDFDESWTCL